VNFAQGEFVMLGGMTTVFLTLAGVPLPLAALLAVVAAVAVGLALHRFAIEPARGASAVVLIMITIGASIFLRGAAQVVFDKRFHSLPPLLGNDPLRIGGASILPQSLIVLAGAVVIVVLLWAFIDRTLFGKAVIATAANRLAARLVGIDTRRIGSFSFAVSAAIGAVAGILVTPITLTSYEVGTLLALKGFAAAMLGGMGNAAGAVVGGLVLGLLEAFAAGYLSSQYKDAVAFLVILGVLFVMPQGLFGRAKIDRV
jgi:branched-chain amino acid transport system permease protein